MGRRPGPIRAHGRDCTPRTSRPLPEFPGEGDRHDRGCSARRSARAVPTRAKSWAINSGAEQGQHLSLLTVTRTASSIRNKLFKDCRGHGFDAPEAKRGMLLNDLQHEQEYQADDPSDHARPRMAAFTLQAGSVGSIVRVEGLEGHPPPGLPAPWKSPRHGCKPRKRPPCKARCGASRGASVKPGAVGGCRSGPHPMVVDGKAGRLGRRGLSP